MSKYKNELRKKNVHNDTYANNVFPIEKVSVGRMSYGPLNVFTWLNKNEELIIGNFVSIAPGVKFILGGNHRHDVLLNFPINYYYYGERGTSYSKGKVVLEDDVWIGMDSINNWSRRSSCGRKCCNKMLSAIFNHWW